MTRRATTTLALAALFLAACPKGGSKPGEEAEMRKEEVRSEMREHFAFAEEARHEVIQGRLDEARGAAAKIGDGWAEGAQPKKWDAYGPLLQQHAKALSEAGTVEEAAGAVAGLAATCGGCHRATGGGPKDAPELAPPDPRGSTRDRMARHLWATDTMWFALITDNANLYRDAADVLATSVWWAEAETMPEDLKQIEARVKQLAGEAQEAGDDTARVEVYGRLLSTCARCHQLRDADPR